MSHALGDEVQALDDPLLEMINKLVQNAAALMLEAKDTAALIDLPSFRVLITTEFGFRKEGRSRGILFDVLIETAGDQVITFMLIVPCEDALFAGTASTHAELLH